jgi:magnesium-protoporphyrin IX monomethyl ester (oxidative) cyclase
MPEPVLLINPPFGAIERPSIGLGLLQASAHREGLSCRTLYANLAFAERIGLDLYFWFANTGEYIDLFGEWVFAGALFQESDSAPEEYIRRFIAGGYTNSTFETLMPTRDLVSTLLQVRKSATEFIEQYASHIVSFKPHIVGITSSFQQNCASIALLKRVRQLDDSIVTLLGGSNCEGEMARGLRRAFPWLDFVVSGEAELIFPNLLRLLLQYGRAVDESLLPQSVIGAQRAIIKKHQEAREVVWDLDATAPPDYHYYFDQLSRSPLANFITPGLTLEASRGCWWGQKRRCKFCGLNGAALKMRSKSADRIVHEIQELSVRYKTPKIEFVDNNLDPRLADKVFPQLASWTEPVTLYLRRVSRISVAWSLWHRLASDGYR